MRAMLCGCNQRLEATDDERLVEVVSTHLRRVHPDHLVASLSREQVRQVIADRAYKLEYALVYEGDEPDEEFGLDPY
ncbi:MAG: DUF1059 domain-containing protein [Rubrobacter sp.]|nr:DUF1059 domain-containing protein [Rubrobacter sp.]